MRLHQWGYFEGKDKRILKKLYYFFFIGFLQESVQRTKLEIKLVVFNRQIGSGES